MFEQIPPSNSSAMTIGRFGELAFFEKGLYRHSTLARIRLGIRSVVLVPLDVKAFTYCAQNDRVPIAPDGNHRFFALRETTVSLTLPCWM